MKSYEEKFMEYLRKNSMKFTPERREILHTACSTYSHFDVEELYEKLKKKGKKISSASVYRTMPLLLGSGLVIESLRCNGKITYEYIYGHGHHGHMVCIKCGKVIEFQEKKFDELEKEMCKKYGFKPVEYKIGIKGYCKDCRQ